MVVAVFWGLGSILSSIDDPVNMDEAEFAAAAIGYMKTGQPAYQVGGIAQYELDLAPWAFGHGPSPDYQLGLWHSSFLVPLIAKIYEVFGISSWATRLPGAVSWLCGFFLLFFMLRGQGQTFKLVFLTLYFSTPLLIQQSLMVDFDNTIGTLALALSLFVYFRYSDKSNFWKLVLMHTLLVGLLCWCKEYMAIYWIPAVFVYEALRKNWKASAAAVLGALLGVGLFWITWSLWCNSMGIAPDYFIRFSFVRRSKGSEGMGDLISLVRSFGWKDALVLFKRSLSQSLTYVDTSFVLLVLFFIPDFKKIFNERKQDLLVLLMALSILLIAKISRPSVISFKYEFAMIPLFIWLIARSLDRRMRAGEFTGLLLVGMLLAIPRSILIGDPLLYVSAARETVASFNFTFLYSVLALTVVGVVIQLVYRLGKDFRRWSLYSLVAGLLAFNMSLGALQRRSYTTVSNYFQVYGESGAALAAAQLRGWVARYPHALVYTRRDLGVLAFHLSGQEGRSWKGYEVLSTPAGILELSKAEVAFILTDHYGRGKTEAIFSSWGFQKIGDFGDFLLFGRHLKK